MRLRKMHGACLQYLEVWVCTYEFVCSKATSGLCPAYMMFGGRMLLVWMFCSSSLNLY